MTNCKYKCNEKQGYTKYNGDTGRQKVQVMLKMLDN